ncbi:hypothetical protein RSJ21_00175 (plasmid) [Clostridium botulinum]|uniref:hypothetical protein n=1 Tax=Clostridium botulinum TaxID=1491 RepID=UPI000C787B80|nr:hypothetical protein [Clostridium botulinum]AUN23753.1 hypothetical protein RSJ21_00175 [Clostridium botulinum]
MDIKEIAKEMTREEFLNSEYIKEIDKEGYFIEYKCVDNEFRTKKHECDCENNVPFSCERCWNNAVKDIKFKEKNNMGINKKIETMNSLEDLKEISKEITREEFLKKAINYNRYCPGQINLKDCSNSDDYSCSTTPCYSCWENAIKDIKFKGETCMEFDWNGFKENEFVVCCDTEEKAKYFLEECYKRGMEWGYTKSGDTMWNDHKSETCYSNDLIGNNKLGYSRKSFYIDNGYKIVEWKIENELDYDREYTIEEMSEDNIYLCNGRKYKINYGDLYYYSNVKQDWTKSIVPIKTVLEMKFKLVKKDKKVSFMEAMESYGKTVYCIYYLGGTKMKNTYWIDSKDSCIFDNSKNPMCPNEILNGEWYIKEN